MVTDWRVHRGLGSRRTVTAGFSDLKSSIDGQWLREDCSVLSGGLRKSQESTDV